MPNQYRYPGTQPFTEANRHIFFGRNTDKKKLSNLIILEKLVVLYGKSGYGKSSLLNAAVIPHLRDYKEHIPYKIRLIPTGDTRQETGTTPLQLIAEHLAGHENANSYLDEKLDVPGQLPEDYKAILWYYLKSIQLANPKKEAITLVFYQFEELFRYYKDPEWEAFGRTFAALLNLNPPDTVLELIGQHLDVFTDEELDKLYEPLNLKVVFSIASDHLNLLNKLKPYLPAIFKYTYELKALEEAHALKALEGPAQKDGDFLAPRFTYSKEALEIILNYLRGRSKQGIELNNQDIETFQLQLIGQFAEAKIREQRKKVEDKARSAKKGEIREPHEYIIQAEDIGNPEKILKQFYNRVIKSISGSKKQKSARHLIENDLIIEGNRVSMSDVGIKNKYSNLSDATLAKLEGEHLLRSEHQLKDNRTVKNYEISHYNLVDPILDSARRRKQRRLWRAVIIIFAAIILALLGLIGYLLSRSPESPDPDDPGTEVIVEQEEVSNGLIINAIATARVYPTSGPAPLDVLFKFRPTNNVDSIEILNAKWVFGDGTDTLKIDSTGVVHTYEKADEYTAILIVDIKNGKTRTEEIKINVLPADSTRVVINAEPRRGDAPLSVQFSATLPAGITAADYLWEFGDPTPLKIPNPTHEYRQQGIHKVRLTVRDNAGVAYIASTDIAVGMPDTITSKPPVARITTFAPEGENIPFKYGFSAEESEDDIGIVRYLWEFHDEGTSKDLRTTHAFVSEGTYIVKLSVWDEDGQLGTDMDTVIVPDPPIPDPLPIIGASVTRGVVPLEVAFTGSNANDTGAQSSYKWDFNDGKSSTEQHPLHVFTNTGTFDIKLEIKENGRVGKGSFTITVDPAPPVAEAEPANATGKAPFQVSFTGSNSTPTDSIRNYFWDFRDNGDTSDLADPQHTFENPGEYKVELTVTNGWGLTARDTAEITVLKDQPPVARITHSEDNKKIPFDIRFDGGSSTDDGTIVNYNWVVGDNLIINENVNDVVLIHTFVNAGEHEVKLTVTDDRGQTSDTIVTVRADSVAKFHIDREADTWMQRFIGIQKNKLTEEFNSPTAWSKWRIIPDSLNIVGVVLPDSIVNQGSSLNPPAALLFFFTTRNLEKDEMKVYKFRNEIDPAETKFKFRSERFNLKRLIRDAKKHANNGTSDTLVKYIAPDRSPKHINESAFKNFAEFLEQNTLNDKTLNLYYTLFPFEQFDAEARQEIEKIMELLRPNKGS